MKGRTRTRASTNLPRLSVPRPVCIVSPCSDEPMSGTLICLIHARALHKRTEQANQAEPPQDGRTDQEQGEDNHG